ncbi:hypothetical protein [Nannocystis punicea]|uniref:MYXO-CTERM domain-containing protein n=1 Tax=Nannocystis punicea TaxID=2995304 RepID=A0ABY7H8W7_9BACT|nr:hypothetical protein [Nannocystis poenicansa]WAS95686.1 hypothetical protein O0S08_05945 [Nannocystis poenicansa]
MTKTPRASSGRAAARCVGLVLACVAGEAAADGVPFDSEKYMEAESSIEVFGVAALGDVVLVVYPYPCETWGDFERFEQAVREGAKGKVELEVAIDDTEEEKRGYLVVREGERFESTTGYEGPMANCYFFGLPRAEFPALDGAIARLDAMTHEERWRLFSRDPSLLRTGVPLAMPGVVKLFTERSRVVRYEVRREGTGLAIEAVRWTWGSGRVQDPRKPSRRDVKVIDPYEVLDDEVEARYFAGSLVGTPWAAGAEEPSVEKAPASVGATVEAKAVSEAKAVEVEKPAPVAAPAAKDEADAPALDPELVYGGVCLLVAAGAGLLLRRRRG